MAKKRKLRSMAEAQPEPVQQPQAEEPPAPTTMENVPVEDVVEAEVEEEVEEEGGNENTSNGVEMEQEEEEDPEDEGEEEEEDLEEDEPVEKLLEPFSKEQLVSLLKEAVSKYPDFTESVRRIADADPAHRKIFVHGLGWDTTSETLISEFGKYGEIEDCKAVTDKVSGKSKGYAFILFKHRVGAKKALKMPQKKIGSRLTSCQLASAGPVTPASQAPAVAQLSVSEYTLRKIFVSNVSAEIDPMKLLEFFKQYGEIDDGPLGLDKQTGKPKGFALFVYKTVESAKKALEEPHKNFEGHTLHCQKAIDGPKPNKHQGYQQQQQHGYTPHYGSRKEKQPKYHPGGHGHLMAPSVPGVGGFNPAVAAQALNPALGQALTALIASQGAGLGLTNLLGGLGGAPMSQAGPSVMGNTGYGAQPGGYGSQAGLPGGYQNPQMGQGGGGRPPQGLNMGGAPYMGH